MNFKVKIKEKGQKDFKEVSEFEAISWSHAKDLFTDNIRESLSDTYGVHHFECKDDFNEHFASEFSEWKGAGYYDIGSGLGNLPLLDSDKLDIYYKNGSVFTIKTV